MKVGLYFGSFNPIHIGHLIIANTMAENTDLEQVWFVVSPHNPFKKQSSLLHEQDRYDMVKFAISENYKLKVTDVEFHLSKPSYTIDTLTVLQEKYPQHVFSLVLGSDNLTHFKKWKNYDKILEYFSIYIYPRPQAKLQDLEDHDSISFVKAPLLDISATFIRNLVKEGKSVKYLVPEEVEVYIQQKGFYI